VDEIALASPRAWLAVVWSVFQLYTAQAGMFDLLIQLPLHVVFAVALALLTPPVASGAIRWWDWLAALLAIACGAYYAVHNPRLVSRMPMVDDPTRFDAVVGVL
jgi:TRAP-type uncharacterized transport system fused permease subunit